MNNLPLIEDLRLFCTVVRKSSFAGSAREIGLSRAYVSKRIALLERSLKVSVLHRTTRRITLTDDGEIVYEWARRILDDVDQMTDAISTAKTSPRGMLRICASSGYGRTHVAPAVAELARRYPALDIQLELLDRPVDLISEGFDIDVRLGVVHEPYLIAKRVACNRRILCAAPDYLARYGTPSRLADLAVHKCIGIRSRDQAFGMWRLAGPNGVETIKVAGPLSASSGEVALIWGLAGHGVVLRSTWEARPLIDSGRLVHLLPDYWHEADVWVAYPSPLSGSAKVRVCVRFLQEWLRDGPDQRSSASASSAL